MLPNHNVTLNDKYEAEEGRVFMSGIQALIRLPMVQIKRDRAAGLKTAGLISGYRGSPLSAYDVQLERSKKWLDEYDIKFQPGLNEELAATALWGSQQLEVSPKAHQEGVFGIWYGKGPGVDRASDVFRHANAAGSSKNGGVLCLAGDDHGAKSSTLPHQTDHAFMNCVMPVLYPSTTSEFLEFGLAGIAMSRYSGCWVGMKVIADTVETTGVIDLDVEKRQFVLPSDFDMPKGGLNIKIPDNRWEQDSRLQTQKAYAAIAWARANKIDRVVLDTAKPRLGIVASGKCYEDVRQALRELDIDTLTADQLGIRLYKVGMPWPLEPEGIRHFSKGLKTILIVEERREIIENQIKQQLFNWREDVRPRIIGKFDDEDQPVLPLDKELTIGMIARAICDRLMDYQLEEGLKNHLQERLSWFEKRAEMRENYESALERTPYFCSGCPHNRSTRVLNGSRGMAGIGCHYMATWMDRSTDTFSHMGGEGVAWTGTAPFTDEKHVFANLGDGTYFHSGILAIRQSVASGVNITYKILYNDAVAMTGGQPHDGALSPQQITHQLFHEGVKKIYLVCEAPERYKRADLAEGVVLAHRDKLDTLMLEAREIKGCTAIIYDQTCAAEKRRRRKRGTEENPKRRVFINADICEGCGDCSNQSNCISIEPLETEFGRKRKINQSSCNKDFSCLNGFCPSFITIEGGDLKKRDGNVSFDFSFLPKVENKLSLKKPYNILVTGVGGTGVLTVGAILGMAAHLDGKASNVLDIAGLAQKGGAVVSHIRLADDPDKIRAPRLTTGSANLLLAADNIVAGTVDGVVLCEKETTRGIINSHLTPTQEFVRDRDFDFREFQVMNKIKQVVQEDVSIENFTNIAEAALGDSIATNILMIGYAYQRALLPLSFDALLRSIELNGVAVDFNKRALNWGRFLAHDLAKVKEILGEHLPKDIKTPKTLEDLLEHRAKHLQVYQNKNLAKKYRYFIQKVKDGALNAGISDEITKIVADNYAKLLAYKDEYEIARLYSKPEFASLLKETFESAGKVNFHLAPPLISRMNKETGRVQKQIFGPYMFKVFKILKHFKVLRGTLLDPFGYQNERKQERDLIRHYEKTIKKILKQANRENEKLVLEIASYPQVIRGYGSIKLKAIEDARKDVSEKLQNLNEKKHLREVDTT